MNEPHKRRKRRSLPPVQGEQISLAFGSMGLRGLTEGRADQGHHPTVPSADAGGRRGGPGERR